MRIIAGDWRGQQIEAPAGGATRPTGDRVRESLFSILSSRLGSFDGLRVADLFAGSGALGMEALSRGARHATFVESNPKAVQMIKRNAARLGAGERIHLIAGSALALPRAEPFDVVFADPPYVPEQASAVVHSIIDAGWLAEGGWLSVETSRGHIVDPATLALDCARDIGRARLTLLRRL